MKVETKIEFQFDYPMPKNFSPSISKPCHLAVLASNLLGLEWEEFDPGIGKYRASGNSPISNYPYDVATTRNSTYTTKS